MSPSNDPTPVPCEPAVSIHHERYVPRNGSRAKDAKNDALEVVRDVVEETLWKVEEVAEGGLYGVDEGGAHCDYVAPSPFSYSE